MESGKRILIADDDPDIIDLLEAYFKRAGYIVTAKVNGKEALQAAETEKFDLVLLDVMMPYIDGYHVASEISSRFGSEGPKIIIMTSRDVAAEKGIAMLSGANDAVQKPFSLEELEAKVRAVLG
ncbi:MAG: response regulator [Elusimicrobia bacterium]|jgi:DNA-binding response OmpR family regulator|nr:response regulator [Elusimicrobiota bacterium]